MSFFILGLPRHRTAWMANLFTYQDMFCYHEGLDGCKTLDEYRDKLGNDGDSNTGLYAFTDVNKIFADRKVIIIEPTPESLENCKRFSMNNFSVSGNVIEQFLLRLQKVKGYRVKFDEIDKDILNIWEYVTNIPFNQKRYQQLKGMRIQVLSVDHYDTESGLTLMGL